MNSHEALFVAGDVDRLASIKIRCREIARRLGCECCYHQTEVDQVPTGYKAYICVKPHFGKDRDALARLAKRGMVVWDILDDDPPRGLDKYIASTAAAAKLFSHLGDISIIPHYHCNFENVPTEANCRAVAYVGSVHWYPKYSNINHDKYFVDRWTRREVAAAYSNVGIGLNHRNTGPVDDRYICSKLHVKPDPDTHVKINSGIKLINCIGFGIPSVCPREPGYVEVGGECTILTDMGGCADAVERLKNDEDLYRTMRANCLEMSKQYHVTRIADLYRHFIHHL